MRTYFAIITTVFLAEVSNTFLVGPPSEPGLLIKLLVIYGITMCIVQDFNDLKNK